MTEEHAKVRAELKSVADQVASMSTEELRREWASRPNQGKPPYERDRSQLAWFTAVRSELFSRMDTRPPAGGTFGAGKK